VECFVPGQVLISPRFSPEQSRGYLAEASIMPFEVSYTIEDILKHYDFGNLIEPFRKRFGYLPMVLRVPEGREKEASEELRARTFIKAACPDLLIRSSGPIVLNVDAVDEAIEFVEPGPLPRVAETGAPLRCSTAASIRVRLPPQDL
jgi:hypothetical protein